MSALAGIVAPVELSPLVETMIAEMSHRQRDGNAFFRTERACIGLGYKKRQAEDPTKAEVFAKDGLRLVSDVRLDNRAELMVELGLDGSSLSDSELILAAYDRWQEECVDHLLGDFAFAVLNPKQNSIFLARDHMGVRPLFYRIDGDNFGFASEVLPLLNLASPFDPVDLRDHEQDTVTAFLSDMSSSDGVGSLVASIYRVLPGHTVTYQHGSAPVIRRYWIAKPSTLKPGPRHEDLLKVALENAVQCRLRSASPISALLSGGLDSTSIVCCAAQIKRRNAEKVLDTFSAVFDATPAHSEKLYIESVLRFEHFNHTYIDFSNYAPFLEFDEALKAYVDIPFAPGFGMNKQLAETMRRAGFLGYLDGHGGDEVISHGYGRLDELAQAGRWRKLWTEIKGVSSLFNEQPSYLMAYYLLKYGKIPGRRALRTIFRIIDSLKSPDTNLLSTKLRTPTTRANEGRSHKSEDHRHREIIHDPSHVVALEILELNAARNGLDILLPFYDVRLIELCLALPSQAKLDGGWTRLVLRKAMEGVIPPQVQWRRSKFDFSHHIAMGMLAHNTSVIETILSDRMAPIAAYADIDRVALAYDRVRKAKWGARGDDIQVLWKILALWFWLKNHNEDNALVEQNV